MNSEFKQFIDQLPLLMERLNSTIPITRDRFMELPDKGVYVYYENNIPLYVGGSDSIRDRLIEHGRQSSTHYNSPLAFNIAKKDAILKGININLTRNDLVKDSEFAGLFSQAKKRVSLMSVRAVPINNPITQNIFLIYASIELNTSEFNSFETH